MKPLSLRTSAITAPTHPTPTTAPKAGVGIRGWPRRVGHCGQELPETPRQLNDQRHGIRAGTVASCALAPEEDRRPILLALAPRSACEIPGSCNPHEKLGVFYLGRYHDLGSGKTLPDPLLYSSNDLLTHALCVGMTGSGKTGLCIDLIEEAAIDGIPAIIVDPKGDLGNLLLTFPELRPADFEPWVDPEAARRKSMSAVDFASRQAELWQNGLAQWDQDGERIRRLREAADFRIYTPGSNAGVPISILNSFAAPPAAVLEDPELLRERVQTTVGGLLGLAGVESDPARGREAIFLSTIEIGRAHV